MSIELIDTHCHLTFEQYGGEIEPVLERSRQAGVTGWITVGTDLEDSRKTVELAQKFDDMYATVGIHPHDAANVDEGQIAALKDLANSDKVVAIGETGLDFYYGHSEKREQKRVFEQQLEIASEMRLPVVVHSRDAYEDTIEILDGFKGDLEKVVVHCFSYPPECATALLERGYYLSYTGVVTFKNAKQARDAVKVTAPERIMVETDCPYLSPEPMRKQKVNEPALMVHTAKFLAELLEMDFEDFARQVTATSRDFFCIS